MLSQPHSPSSIIFIPGFGLKARIIESCFNSLNITKKIYLDLPKLPNNSPNKIIDYMTNYFYTKIPSHATIIAWSLGGLLAIDLCARFNYQYSQLILVGCTPCFFETKHWDGISHTQFATLIQLAGNNPNRFIKRFFQEVQYPNSNKVVKDQIYAMSLLKDANLTSDFMTYLNLIFSLDHREKYAKINIPVYHIHGTQDAIVSAKMLNQVQTINPLSALHWIENAGHAPFLTHPIQFLNLLKNIIDGQTVC